MKQGAVFLLVFGLTNLLNAAELGLEGVSTSELKEIEQEIAKGNVPPNYTPIDKSKRGVVKLTNTDNPSFNHLTSTTSAKTSSSSSSSTNTNQTPLRYVYNYPSTPYYSYLQTPHHAAQIAAQYAFQPPGVTHYLQTPTQIQYVTSPTVSQVPTSRYQTINGKTVTTNVAASGSVSVNTNPSAATSQYVSNAQPLLLTSPQYVTQNYVQTPASGTTTGGQTTATTSMAAAYQNPQQLYYPQQPVVMLLVQPQPHPMTYLYQNQHGQATAAHQMFIPYQNPFLNYFGGHRFALPYSPAQASQVTYLVPMAVTTPQQTATASSAATAAVDKTVSNTQETAASNTFGLRTTKS